MGVGFMAYNRNKKSLALNLKSDEGRDLYRALVAKSDIVVENLSVRGPWTAWGSATRRCRR